MTINKDQQANDFWDYSLAVYQVNKIQTLCLQLQDEVNADVNLILFSAWLAKQKISFTAKRVLQAGEKITQWQESVIKPLRRVRVTVKAISSQSVFYEKIKAAELAAEFESQQRLYFLSSSWQTESNKIHVVDNLRCYFLSLGNPDVQLKQQQSIELLAELLNEENKKHSI